MAPLRGRAAGRRGPVAERERTRNARALFDLLPPEQRQRMLEGMKAGDG
jgi:hypothetical protein